MLCDYRDQVMPERNRLINRLRWPLVRIAPKIEAQLGPAALKGPRIRARLARQLGQLQASPELRFAKAQLRRINAIEKEQRELFAELTALIQAHAPQLLEQERARRECIEATRVERLLAEMATWRRSEEIRAYVAVLEERVPALDRDEQVRIAPWCRWARERADEMDPTRRTSLILGLDDA